MEEAEKGEILERSTKSRVDNHPAEAASLFTEDLILEILSRLPARSLHRFKCVSVSWRDLIADPSNRNKLPQILAGFLYTTVSNNARRHHFVGVSGDGAAPFDPCLLLYPQLQGSHYKDIAQVDACNGLLLYRHFNKKKIEDGFRFVVCNPATGRWVELPPQPQPQEPANRYSRTAGTTMETCKVGNHIFRKSKTNQLLVFLDSVKRQREAKGPADSVRTRGNGLFILP